MQRLSRSTQGVLLVVLAMACFAVLDTMAKYVSTLTPLVVAMWSRYMFQVLATSAVLLPQRGRGLFKTRHPRLQIFRGVLLACSSSLAFLSLSMLPVGEFTAILMLTPMLITLISVRKMGERVSAARWLLLAGGLAGALLVIRPGAEDFNWAMLIPVLLVIASAVFRLLTSYLSQDDEPGTTNFYTGAVAASLATLMLPFGWITPSAPSVWGFLLLLGLFSTLGHILMIQGYSRASPATLTPFLYFQLGFATLAGWLAFAHTPDVLSLAGIALIAVCGVGTTLLKGPKPGMVESEPAL